MKKKFYVCCRLGCTRRSLDTSTIFNYLEQNGWSPAGDMRRADLLVAYTCGGFANSEERSVITVERMLRNKKPSAKVIVTGCLLKIRPVAVEHLEADFFLKHEELQQLDALIGAEIPYRTVSGAYFIRPIDDLVPKDYITAGNPAFLKRRIALAKQRYRRAFKREEFAPDPICYLTIARGCLGKCSYCSIRRAAGTLVSKPLGSILEEFHKGLEAGFKRFGIIGEDTGCYGLDIGTDVVLLMERIFSHPEDFSVKIIDFNINWIIKYQDRLVPLLKNNRQRIEDLRVPIQSGSDRILRLMKRPYRSDQVRRILARLKTEIPGLKIITHLLVGFPGETEADFQETMRLVEDFAFAAVAIYKFEPREGTAAAILPGQVSTNVILRRAAELQKAFIA